MEIAGTIIASALLFFAAYGLILVLAGVSYQRRKTPQKTLPTIKVLLPAYKPDQIFLEVLKSLKKAKKNYPIDVFILFQNADRRIVDAANSFGFDQQEKVFDHLPGNSYRHALQYLCAEHLDESTHEYTMILDKDNIVDTSFFEALKTVPVSSYHVVQGARNPLQTTEGMQLFDAISEKYNDLMLRKGKIQLGGILEVSGSAALIRTNLFKYAISSLDEQAPGYDKNFMVRLLSFPKKLNTTFVEEMKVYEEKTAEIENYKSQRLRWFGEQYFNAIYNFRSLISNTFLKGKLRSIDYWLTLVRPPRSLQLLATALFLGLDLLDGYPGFYAIPFLLNLLSFGIVSFQVVKPGQLRQFLSGMVSVLVSNIFTSAVCLQKKYQNTFIHTR